MKHNAERDARIVEEYRSAERLRDIADMYDLTTCRISEIVSAGGASRGMGSKSPGFYAEREKTWRHMEKLRLQGLSFDDISERMGWMMPKVRHFMWRWRKRFGADACHDEAVRRGKPELYKEAFERARA